MLLATEPEHTKNVLSSLNVETCSRSVPQGIYHVSTAIRIINILNYIRINNIYGYISSKEINSRATIRMAKVIKYGSRNNRVKNYGL